jgi:apolipoprotein N-acyltransferase
VSAPRLARALGAAVLAAALYTCAFAPREWWAAAWLVPPLLLLPTRGLGPWRAALCGGIFGTLIGLGVAGWLVHASLGYFEVDRAQATAFVVLVWLASGAPYAVLTGVHARLAPAVPPWARAATAAWLWAAMEMLRLVVTGNPWALLAHTQLANPTLIQIADLGGAHAVSFLIALVSVAAGELVVSWRSGAARRTAVRGLAVAMLVLAAASLYGVRARQRYAAPGDTEGRSVVVVQGNVTNAFRWKRVFFDRMVATYAGLSRAAIGPDTDLVVWPENAVNFYLEHEPMLLARIAAVARLTRAGLLLGAPRLADPRTAHNSVHLLAPDGRIAGSYDKQRLLPFAEHDPLGLRAPTADEPLYAPGRGGGVLAAGPMRVGVVVCFEALFPAMGRARVHDGAEVLVNLSNDSWLDAGDGAASRQHFVMAAFRAIETRRWLVRAAGTGVSGIVAPTGDVVASVAANQSGTAAGTVTPRQDVTPYVRFGEAWLAVLGLALAVAMRARA